MPMNGIPGFGGGLMSQLGKMGNDQGGMGGQNPIAPGGYNYPSNPNAQAPNLQGSPGASMGQYFPGSTNMPGSGMMLLGPKYGGAFNQGLWSQNHPGSQQQNGGMPSQGWQNNTGPSPGGLAPYGAGTNHQGLFANPGEASRLNSAPSVWGSNPGFMPAKNMY